MNKKEKRPKFGDMSPERILAISIIEEAIEPWRGHGIQGEGYYKLEDAITSVIVRKT